MAITEIRPLRALRLTESLDPRGRIQVTASEELLIVSDTANPEFRDIATSPTALPPYGAPVPGIGMRITYGGYVLVCSNRQWSYYDEENEFLVKLVAEYTSLSETQEEPNKPEGQAAPEAEAWQNITLETYAIEKPARGWKKRDEVGIIEHPTLPIDDYRKPAMNAAGDVVDGLTMQSAGLRMSYVNSKVESPNFEKLFEYVNTCNDGKWLGADDYTVRIAGYRTEYDQKNQTWSVSVEFVYDPSGQQIQYINAGFNEKIASERRAITDKAGNPVTKPVPLKEDGEAVPLVAGNAPYVESQINELTLYPYAAKNFDNFFDECGI